LIRAVAELSSRLTTTSETPGISDRARAMVVVQLEQDIPPTERVRRKAEPGDDEPLG
jgi:hypothetical protein